jgi:hypothetical protein
LGTWWAARARWAGVGSRESTGAWCAGVGAWWTVWSGWASGAWWAARVWWAWLGSGGSTGAWCAGVGAWWTVWSGWASGAWWAWTSSRRAWGGSGDRVARGDLVLAIIGTTVGAE